MFFPMPYQISYTITIAEKRNSLKNARFAATMNNRPLSSIVKMVTLSVLIVELLPRSQ